jgi:hypothetical protein
LVIPPYDQRRVYTIYRQMLSGESQLLESG